MQQELRRPNRDRHAHTDHPATTKAPHPPLWLLPVMLLAGVLLLFGGVTAQTPPPNDDIANATVITALPFTDGPIDTTAATTELNDPDCFGNGLTVWYVFTPSEDVVILADPQANSNYDTTLSVYTGSPGALTQIACSDDRVIFEATAGTTYYFMVGNFFFNSSGTLIFHAEVAPPSSISTSPSMRRGSSIHPRACRW
jgi:hypothetical protein